MSFISTIPKYFLLIVFTTRMLVAEVVTNEHLIQQNQKEEVLEEQQAPLPSPSALIDLNQNNKGGKKETKYASMYLFLFNVTLFTIGMAVVKSITGNKV